MLGKLFGLGGSQAKDRSDSGSGNTAGSGALGVDPKGQASGKKGAKQRINQKLEDAFKGDFDEEEEKSTNAAQASDVR